MVLSMMGETEPPHREWAAVVVVVGLRAVAADLARLALQCPAPDCALHGCPRPLFARMRCAPSSLRLERADSPVRRPDAGSILGADALSILLSVFTHVPLRACLTLPEQAVRHRRVRVERGARPSPLAFEAAFHG
jgi:hypothetical protein